MNNITKQWILNAQIFNKFKDTHLTLTGNSKEFEPMKMIITSLVKCLIPKIYVLTW
jgi:hypothetical protein